MTHLIVLLLTTCFDQTFYLPLFRVQFFVPMLWTYISASLHRPESCTFSLISLRSPRGVSVSTLRNTAPGPVLSSGGAGPVDGVGGLLPLTYVGF